jgi:hypothetical protein
MKTQLLTILIFIRLIGFGQNKFTISGYVKDLTNGEAMIGATVSKQGTSIGASTNAYGFYSFTLPSGTNTIAVNYIGYKSSVFVVNLRDNTTKDIEIEEEGKQLEEVEISSEATDKNIKSVEMGVTRLDIKQINKIPALMGEVDLVRVIQLLPGVTTVGEGASGFNVRGGNIDQNLILLDEAPVYNSSHMLGFFSVFNPDAVKDVKLIKGGVPSQYGGRVSSILDIRMKEGNDKKMEVNGGVGSIFSRLSIEAPLIKDKASFIIAGRRSYADVLAKPFLRNKPGLSDSKLNFYDLTAKINYKINSKNTVFASGYFGRDVLGASFGLNWGNATTTLRWNHVFNNKLFMNLTSFYSNYDYQLAFQDNSGSGFQWKSSIVNYSFKPDFTYYANNKNTLRFGAQVLYYDFAPGTATVEAKGVKNDVSLDKRFGAEYSGYIGNEWKASPRLTLEYGLRYSLYTYLGSGTKYNYAEAEPNTERTLISKEKVATGKIIQQYVNPEPRFSANYNLNQSSSVKLSYNRMAQYIQLISNTAASTPLDIYTLATNNLKPLVADQGSVGYFRNFKNNMFETSVEVYYKALQNQLDYIDKADLFLNPQVEAQLVQGKGRAYGAEFYIKKTKGRLTGWLSYTLSKTERKVFGISNDKWYNSRYDRTHSLNAVASFDLTKRWNISTSFALLSGTPATFPNSKLEVQGWNIPYNTDGTRNNYRISSYNRLDLGATYNFKRNDTHRYKQTIVFSVYNAYNRRNAFSVYFSTKKGDALNTQAYRYSVIGSIIPAVTYNFKF